MHRNKLQRASEVVRAAFMLFRHSILRRLYSLPSLLQRFGLPSVPPRWRHICQSAGVLRHHCRSMKGEECKSFGVASLITYKYIACLLVTGYYTYIGPTHFYLYVQTYLTYPSSDEQHCRLYSIILKTHTLIAPYTARLILLCFSYAIQLQLKRPRALLVSVFLTLPTSFPATSMCHLIAIGSGWSQ